MRPFKPERFLPRPIRFLGLFLALLCIASCESGGPGNNAGDSPGVTQLRYLTWGADPDEIKIVQTLINEFEKEHPEIKVQLITVPGATYYSKLLTMIAGRTPPDVVYMQPANFLEFASRGALKEIDEFVESDPDIHLEDFYPQARDAYSWQGRVYGLPCDAGAIVLYYNKALFDARGVPYPDASWDHGRLLDAARRLTLRDDRGRTTQYGYMPFSWECAVWQFGGRILSEDGKTCLLNSPEAVEAFQYLLDLRNEHGVAPSFEIESSYAGPAGAGAEELFKAGKLAMVEYGRWMMIHFGRHQELSWDIAVLPRGKSQAASLVIGLGWCIPKHSAYPREAYEFMKFMASPHALKLTASLGLLVPARKSVAESPEFLAQYPDHNLRAFSRSMEFGRMHPPSAHSLRLLRIVQEQMEFLFLGRKTAKQTCDDIVVEVNALLR